MPGAIILTFLPVHTRRDEIGFFLTIHTNKDVTGIREFRNVDDSPRQRTDRRGGSNDIADTRSQDLGRSCLVFKMEPVTAL